MKKLAIFFIVFFILLLALPDYASANQGAFFLNRGQKRLNQENYQGAIEDFTKSIYIMRNNADCYLYRAKAKRELGNYKSAIADYTMAIDIVSRKGPASKKPLIYGYRSLMKQKIEDYQGALEDAKTAKDIYRQQNNFKMYKSVLQSIKVIEAQLAQQKAENSKTALSAKSYMEMAKEDFEKKDYKTAIEKISKAAEQDPSNPFIYRMRAISQLKLGNIEGALTDLYRARDLYEEQSNFEGYEKILNLIEKVNKLSLGYLNISILAVSDS